MRAQAKGCLAAMVVMLAAAPAWGQSGQLFQGGLNPQQVRFVPIDTSQTVAPIQRFPQGQGQRRSSGFNLGNLLGGFLGFNPLDLLGLNPTATPAQNAPTVIPQTATPQPFGSGIRNFVGNITPGFFRHNPNSPTFGPLQQGRLDLSVFQPVRPFTPSR